MSLLIQAASYVGDYAVGDTVRIKFNATDAAGTLTALTAPTVKAYKDDDGTESTAGITLTEGFDSRTGLYSVIVDTSADGTFYSKGSEFELVLTAGSLGLISVVGTTVGHFSLANRTLADGKAHGGTPGSSTATLALKQAQYVNDAGVAFICKSTAADTDAVQFVGGASWGSGLVVAGGNNLNRTTQGGSGLFMAGSAAGGDGWTAIGGGDGSAGLRIVADGDAQGIVVTSGLDGSNEAIRIVGNTGAPAVFVLNNGAHQGNSSGPGVRIQSTSSSSCVATNATNATPIVITKSGFGYFPTGTVVTISGVEGNTAANGTWTITRTGANTFSLDDSVGNGVFSGAGTITIASEDAVYIDAQTSGKHDVKLGGSGTISGDFAAFVESYAADGATGKLSQLLYQILSAVSEFSIAGTTITCKKLDGSTSAMTFTIDSATAPTSRTRVT